ncbi:MAG: hypothetical protein ACRD5L_06150, partial [Bryobacteraceae bacterium]
LDVVSRIPASLPLEVLSKRMVIARDLPIAPLDIATTIPSHVPLDVLGSPVAVPKDARPPALVAHTRVSAASLPDVLDPDLMTTGEVNLLTEPRAGLREEAKWVLRGASAVLHALALLILLLISQMMPAHQPTQAEIDSAARQLGYLYLPPDLKNVPRPAPVPEPKSSEMRINPGLLKRLQELNQNSSPMPAPVQPPVTAKPQEQEALQPPVPDPDRSASPAPTTPQPQHVEPGRQAPAIEPLKPENAPPTSSGLILPKLSAGTSIQQSMKDLATNPGSSGPIGFSGQIPALPGGGSAGGGQGYLGGAEQKLTPSEGVAFYSSLALVLLSF